MGTKNLHEILSERERISEQMQNSLDDTTDPWGVKVGLKSFTRMQSPVGLIMGWHQLPDCNCKISTLTLMVFKIIPVMFCFRINNRIPRFLSFPNDF